MDNLFWMRVRDGLYEGSAQGIVRAHIKRNNPPKNSHFSLWCLRVGDWQVTATTLREAKRFATRRLYGDLRPLEEEK